MESPEGGSRFGKAKKILQAGLVVGALFVGKGNANSEEPQLPNTTSSSDYSQTENGAKASNPENLESKSVNFETFMQGLESNIKTPEDIVIFDQETLNEHWEKINIDKNRPVPTLKEGEAIVLSSLGASDSLKGLEITGIKQGDDGVVVDVTTYDLNSEQDRESSPFHAVNVSGLDSQTPIQFSHSNAEGTYDFGVSSSATSSQQTNEYSAQVVNFTPHH